MVGDAAHKTMCGLAPAPVILEQEMEQNSVGRGSQSGMVEGGGTKSHEGVGGREGHACFLWSRCERREQKRDRCGMHSRLGAMKSNFASVRGCASIVSGDAHTVSCSMHVQNRTGRVLWRRIDSCLQESM